MNLGCASADDSLTKTMDNEIGSLVPQGSSDTLLEFRTLSMLLTAVTTINRGQPSEPRQLNNLSSKRLKERDLALNAVAAILVRGHEIIAVSAQDPSSDQPLQIYAMQDGPKGSKERDDSSQCSSRLWKFGSLPPITAITNSDKFKPDRNFQGRKKNFQYAMVNKGDSFYDLISNSHWKCLNIK